MKIYALLVLWSLVVSCSSATEKSQSQISGIGSPVSRVLRDIPDLDQPRLSRFVVSLQEAGRLVSGSAGSSTTVTGSDALGGSYLKALRDLGGVPRHQGARALRQILAPDANACGGGSCARVFGIKSESVEPFLDNLTIKTGLSSSLLQPENREIRVTLLSSLRPQAPISQDEAFSQVLAEISAAVPVKLPKKVPEPSGMLERRQFLQHAGEDFVKAVNAYSGSEYSNIRLVEGGSLDDIKKSGITDRQIAEFRDMIEKINGGLAKLSVYQQTVYRGIKEVPRDQIQSWRAYWEKDQPFGLGLQDKPGLTSTSWDPEIAKKFMGAGHTFGVKNTYGVILEISHHNGVSIQNISRVFSEKEVLIPSRMLFKIEQMSLLDQTPGIIHIKLRGVEQASFWPKLDQFEKLAA